MKYCITKECLEKITIITWKISMTILLLITLGLCLAILTVLPGCNTPLIPTPAPIPPIEVVLLPQPDRGPLLAAAIAKEVSIVVPPDDNPKPPIKVGDTCPSPLSAWEGCGGTGWNTTDGSVRVKCNQCGGDGRIDKGDPILSTTSFTQKSQEKSEGIVVKKKLDSNPQVDTAVTKEQEIHIYQQDLDKRTQQALDKKPQTFDYKYTKKLSVIVEGSTFYFDKNTGLFSTKDKLKRLAKTYDMSQITQDGFLEVCYGDRCTKHTIRYSSP